MRGFQKFYFFQTFLSRKTRDREKSGGRFDFRTVHLPESPSLFSPICPILPRMGNKRRILLVTLLIAALGFFSWLLLRPDPEPTYQGKPLSYWCEQYSNGQLLEQARIAIRTIGTNAIPTLLRMLKSKDSSLKLKLMQFAQMQHVIKFGWKLDWTRYYEAELAFACLGSDGKSAVPALLEIYNEGHSDPRHSEPMTISIIFGFMGPAAADAVPRLVRATTDTNYPIRVSAVETLGQIHARSELSVPALTTSLRDPSEHCRRLAAQGLASFGTSAASAVPELIKSLAAPSSTVVGEASSALKKIDAAAAKAGVK